MDLGGAGEQLVPAHHSLAKVNFVQPHIGLPDQGLLHKLATVGHQEQLEKTGHGINLAYIYINEQGIRSHELVEAVKNLSARLVKLTYNMPSF